MAEQPFGVDPSPHQPLASDLDFAVWLENQEAEVVELDRSANFSSDERARLRYIRLFQSER